MALIKIGLFISKHTIFLLLVCFWFKRLGRVHCHRCVWTEVELLCVPVDRLVKMYQE